MTSRPATTGWFTEYSWHCSAWNEFNSDRPVWPKKGVVDLVHGLPNRVLHTEVSNQAYQQHVQVLLSKPETTELRTWKKRTFVIAYHVTFVESQGQTFCFAFQALLGHLENMWDFSHLLPAHILVPWLNGVRRNGWTSSTSEEGHCGTSMAALTVDFFSLLFCFKTSRLTNKQLHWLFWTSWRDYHVNLSRVFAWVYDFLWSNCSWDCFLYPCCWNFLLQFVHCNIKSLN